MIRWCLLVSILFLSIQGKAGTRVPIIPEKQMGWISFNSEYGSELSSSEEWISFCDRLGKQLSIPDRGFLSSYACDSSQSSVAPPSSPFLWQIQLTERKGSLELQLNFLLNGVSHKIRNLSFPTEAAVLNSLKDEALPALIARMLVESSPTGWAYGHANDKLSFDVQDQILLLPPDLFIYDLFFDEKEGLWLPRLRARMSRNEDEDREKIGYSIDTHYLPLESGETYWVRSLQYSTERQVKYQKMITNALKRAKDLSPSEGSRKKKVAKGFVGEVLLDSFRSSYMGVRYGKSIIPSSSVVTQVSMISVFAEVGGGPLSGLRWNYDLFPRVKKASGANEEYFGLKRASLGWAFSFETPAFLRSLVTKIDVQPKIGLVDLSSRLSTPTPRGNVSLDFDAKNIYDLALEIGAERSTRWIRGRLWGAFNTANIGLSDKAAVSVKSSRVGIDAHFDLFTSGDWNMNLLTFGALEHLEIAKDPKSLDDRTPRLQSFTSNLYFAGIGFTLSW